MTRKTRSSTTTLCPPLTLRCDEWPVGMPDDMGGSASAEDLRGVCKMGLELVRLVWAPWGGSFLIPAMISFDSHLIYVKYRIF